MVYDNLVFRKKQKFGLKLCVKPRVTSLTVSGNYHLLICHINGIMWVLGLILRLIREFRNNAVGIIPSVDVWE